MYKASFSNPRNGQKDDIPCGLIGPWEIWMKV